jgi:hypothetical protein
VENRFQSLPFNCNLQRYTVALGLESTVLPGLNLISHVDAMTHIHKPEEVYQVFEARQRLAFEELLLVQVRFLQERDRALKKSGEGVSIVSTARCDELRNVLDFSLTPGQETALEEILHDMAGTTAMLRLVQGDVGCGKTVVAALGILAAVGNGHQGALMAPTVGPIPCTAVACTSAWNHLLTPLPPPPPPPPLPPLPPPLPPLPPLPPPLPPLLRFITFLPEGVDLGS